MNDSYLKHKFQLIQELPTVGEKSSKSFKIWKTVKEENSVYSDLLNLINNFDESKTFNDLKKQLENLSFFRNSSHKC